MKKWYRHGDVIIIESELPKGAEFVDRDWLALGEVTGHAHRLESTNSAKIYQTKDGKTYLRVVAPTGLRHEEHHTRTIPVGDFEIRTTKETDHMSGVSRRVAD